MKWKFQWIFLFIHSINAPSSSYQVSVKQVWFVHNVFEIWMEKVNFVAIYNQFPAVDMIVNENVAHWNVAAVWKMYSIYIQYFFWIETCFRWWVIRYYISATINKFHSIFHASQWRFHLSPISEFIVYAIHNLSIYFIDIIAWLFLFNFFFAAH